MTKIAVLQMTSGIAPEQNFRLIAEAAEQAKQGGAVMLFTPEMSLLLDQKRARATGHIVHQENSEFPAKFQALADDLEIWISVGLPVRIDQESGAQSGAKSGDGARFANRQWLFAPGAVSPHHYDKIHMFDVELSNGEFWRESSAYRPGTKAVSLPDTPVGRLGLTICYDLRFPALFEALGKAQCDAITVPAAFTVPTGAAHWEVMLRARAIEASAYIIAPAQVGTHEDGRTTYGHSLVVDPWGDIILDLGGEEPSLGFAEIDFNRIAEVRRQIPSLANRREILT
jgi:predicted amidohydrolase